jgi:hypothetical protein
MKFSIDQLRIEAPISSIYRQKIANKIKHQFEIPVEFSGTDEITQYLDVGTSAALAGIVLAMAQLLLTVWATVKEEKWTLDKVKEKVRQGAAEFAGTDELTDLRFYGLVGFLENKQDSCHVKAEIHDELYTFIVLRRGKVIAIKHKSN